MSVEEVKSLLPHREPFLFCHKVEVEGDKITGYRKFTEEDFFFKGHFPDYPVVPGVLLVEAMAQTGGAGLKKGGTLAPEGLFFLTTIEKAKFKRQVVPGDEVRFEIENEKVFGRMIKQKGVAYVGEEVAASASWSCMLGEKQ